ncbi:hypothetical protein Gogos_007778, partial [Gossypium gossypioides]|nr:hypothetical protein [Gossypium gossypioides]
MKLFALLPQITLVVLLVIADQSIALSFASFTNVYGRQNGDVKPGFSKHSTALQSVFMKDGMEYGRSPPLYVYPPSSLPPQSPPTIRYPPPSQDYPPPIYRLPPPIQLSPPIESHPPPTQYSPPAQ